ncbi:MAG: hypothetical protein WBH78_01925 [Bacteroidales bacterium]|jgi:hypothetical protein
MLKKQYVELFKEVRAMPLEETCAPFLATLCFGYRQLLFLSYVDPGFTEDFGEEALPLPLAERMRQAIDGLAGNLNRELEEDEWARNIVYLLEALAFQYDSEQLHTALNAMNDFFAGRGMEAYEKRPGFLEDICKMCSYRFYFTSSNESARKAKALLEGWLGELSGPGIWEGMSIIQAFKRIEALVLYTNIVNQNTFNSHIRRLLETYSKAEGIEYEVRLLPILDESGYFNKYRAQARRTLEYLLHAREHAKMLLQEQLMRTEKSKEEIMRKHVIPCEIDSLLQVMRFYLLGIYWYHTTALENGNVLLSKKEGMAW